MRTLYALALVLCISLLSAQTERGPQRILLTDVNIFNGVDEQTLFGNTLIEGNRIARISADPIPVDRSANTRVIDGKGRYVIPGLIDAHTHLLFESVPQSTALFADFALLNLMAAKAAERQLLRGFTTVRDLGGGALSLAKAIDLGLVAGPRVFASGAFISQTGGHGVVAEGAYADLILVDGNPLENIDLVADPGRNFKLIVKDGVIYKDAME